MRPASEAEKARLNETFAELCRDPEPVRRTRRAIAAHVTRELEAHRPRRRGRRARQPARPHPRPLRAHGPALRAPRHGRGDAARSSRCRRRRLGERARHDPRRRQQGRGRGVPRGRAARERRGLAGRPRAAVHRRGGGRARRRQGVRRVACCAPTSATSSTTRRRSARSSSPRRPTTALSAEFHGRAAHAGIRPEAGRSAILAAAHAIAAMPHGRIDEETTANVGSIQRRRRLHERRPRALPPPRRGALARPRPRRDGRRAA